MMTWFDILMLFGLNCMLLPCEGVVYPPSSGKNLIFLPGSNAKIEWTFDDKITSDDFRIWSFTSTDGSFNSRILAFIRGNGNATIRVSFPVISIEKPATLVLRNVDRRYDGKYRLRVSAVTETNSEVIVIIAVAPNITFSCFNSSTVNEGENFTCVCKGEGGRPTANVTWYDKNGVQIGVTGRGKQLLTLTNVDKTHSGTYTCKAQSHINATDKNSIEIRIRLIFRKPGKTKIKFTPEKVVLGRSINITCESDGHPEPSYIITHNDTEVSNGKTFTIHDVNYTHAGKYKCFAKNEFGNDSASDFLVLIEPEPVRSSTNLPTTNQTSLQTNPVTATTPQAGDGSGKIYEKCNGEVSTKWYIIVVTLVSGIIIGVLSYVAVCFRRKFKSRKPSSNSEPPTTELDPNYRELDLTRMNTEDNYQSLRGDVARNDGVISDESNYTALAEVRDVESNYQPLT
ncbi:neural cell adhesion molecule 1-like [Dendronephthya gigantea]|uniref:neural cell adhesion molecule 1-like n=1 Tax=Dendronephthya gigantea TaxID=151771 RepID=UPI00106BBB0A|nr:neural cell adhesion molecule 1-like [Dendronephthya gigantea]